MAWVVEWQDQETGQWTQSSFSPTPGVDVTLAEIVDGIMLTEYPDECHSNPVMYDLASVCAHDELLAGKFKMTLGYYRAREVSK
jgi:hypothetical protein